MPRTTRPAPTSARPHRRHTLLTLAATAVTLAPTLARATSGTWTGADSATNTDWANPNNWLGGIIADNTLDPAGDSTASFSTLDLTADATVTVDSGRTISHLTFADTNTATPGGWSVTGPGPLTLATTTPGAAPTLTVGTLAPGKVATINTPLTLNQGYEKLGPGTLAIRTNTAAAPVGPVITLTAGTLDIASARHLDGTTFGGTLAFNGGTLRVSTPADTRVGGAAGISVASGTTSTISYQGGGTSVAGGFIWGNSGSTPFSGSGTLNFIGDATPTDTNPGAIAYSTFAQNTPSNNFTGVLNISNVVQTFRGSANGPANGTINLTNASVLGVNRGSQSPSVGALNGTLGTVLTSEITGGALSVNYSLGGAGVDATFAGTVRAGLSSAGIVNLNKVGAATQTLTGPNSYTGATNVSAGALVATGASVPAATLADAVTSAGSTTVTLPSTAGLVPGLGVTGAGLHNRAVIVSIDSPTQVTLNAPATASATTSLSIRATGPLGTGSLTIFPAATAQFGNGATAGSPANSAITNNGTLTFNHTNDVSYLNPLSGTGALTKSGPGKLTLANVRQTSVSLSAGTLAVAPNGSTAATSVINSLSLAPNTKLDLADNALVLDYTPGSTSPLNDIRTLIASAATPNLTWTGAGLTSSSAAARANHVTPGPATSLGYDEAAAYITRTTSNLFAGQTVDDSAVLVLHTFTGDANLSGLVDDADVNTFIAHYNNGLTTNTWTGADFTYDGVVNDLDLDLLAAASADPLASTVTPAALARLAALTAVPEPATATLLALAACLSRATSRGGFATTRRRNRA